MKSRNHSLEILEARIAPAAVTPLLPDPTNDPTKFVQAIPGSTAEVHAGQVLEAGTKYLLYVQKGEALVFFTDLNNNGRVDFNEVTGIAAGDGLDMISFVDIHGDIVTNLRETTVTFPGAPAKVRLTLSDSDNNASNDDPHIGGDGRVLLDTSIAKITLRALTRADVGDANRDGVIDDLDSNLHQAPTTFSIFGNIYAGKGFGTADGKGGLVIDTTNQGSSLNFGETVIPTIGSIKTGTAASGEFFSFGASQGNSSGVTPVLDDQGHQVMDNKGKPAFEQDNPNISGTFATFVPPRGEVGGNINGIHVAGASLANNTFTLNIDTLHAGDGGIGAQGGSILNVSIPKDDSGGYQIIAGNGGNGPAGGNGGIISNLSDFGSTTGYVLVASGDGGTGATGPGGNGGNVSFGSFTPRANVHLELGSGGSGFTLGGNGSSLLSGLFTQANAPAQLNGMAGVGDMHLPGSIGTHTAVDFNGDGFGDFVYTTGGGNSQTLVELGGPGGGFTTEIPLDGARDATALVVADLNGDGHPDIAVGSSDAGSQQGIVVYLSKYVNSKFVGFESPRYSVLPQLQDGQANTVNAFLPYFESPQQINQIVAGDFNGDGKVELAVLETQYGSRIQDTNNQVSSLGNASNTILYLQPEVQNDYLHKLPGGQPAQVLTGQFYADFGTTGQGTNLSPIVRSPFYFKAGDKIEASVISIGAGHDSIFSGGIGGKAVTTVDYVTRDNGFTPGKVGSYALGVYDAARPTPPKSSNTPVLLQDFSVFDYNNNGIADLAVLSTQSGGLLVGVKGDGMGSGMNSSGGDVMNVDDAGNVFGQLPLAYNVLNPGAFLHIKTGDFLAGAGVVVFDGEAGNGARTFVLSYAEGPQGAGGAKLFKPASYIEFNPGSNSATTSAFGLHYASTSNPGSAIPGATPLDGRPALEFGFSISDVVNGFAFQPSLPTSSISFNQIGLEIHAGDGGNSLLGKGGIGGSVGSGRIVVAGSSGGGAGSTPGSVANTTVSGNLNLILAGAITLTAGNGGDGFSIGGLGGSISGTNLSYRGNDVGVGLVGTAGHGGRGVSGAGGAGGGISYNTFQTSLSVFGGGGVSSSGGTATAYELFLTAGDGGEGNVGGSGGSVLGNGTVQIDTIAGTLIVRTGSGGSGMHGGGSGGSVANYRPVIDGIFSGDGEMFYIAGNGGSTVAGAGGAGGSVINSSPLANAFIDGTVEAIGGNGGNGATGGAGGQVRNVIVTVTAQSNEPSQLTLLGGIGGNGTSGRGGLGGSITGVNVGARGGGDPFSPLDPSTLNSPDFNRVIAGDGGSSSGNVGGDGGNIVYVRSGSKAGAFALIAGAGGDGLLAGGNGGGVLGSQLDLGGKAVNKGLVISGAGGNAFAFVPNTQVIKLNPALPGSPADAAPNQSQNSFGGVIGRGGHGGSINGFIQTGESGAHLDLIAGNGGSTENFGTIFDVVSHVGDGGGIVNVSVLGDLGNATDPTIPIKSYNNIQTGQTVAQFVDTVLRTGSTSLDDGLGNVGVVVGVAGTNKGLIVNPVTKPLVKTFISPPKAMNGSLINVSFNHLLSAVADSVDHIAAIQLVKNLQPTSGQIGADKNIPAGVDPTTFKGYIGVAGNPVSTPEVGGQLIDGAVVGKLFENGLGTVFQPSGHEFLIPTGF